MSERSVVYNKSSEEKLSFEVPLKVDNIITSFLKYYYRSPIKCLFLVTSSFSMAVKIAFHLIK